MSGIARLPPLSPAVAPPPVESVLRTNNGWLLPLPVGVPVERRVGIQSGEVCAFHPPKRSAARSGPQKCVCFGSGSVQVEGEMLMVFEPGRVQIRIQAIAGNEGVHIIHTQVRV